MTVDPTQVASAVAAAVAALGSVGVAGLMYRQWTTSRIPSLSVDLDPFGPPLGKLTLRLVNYGGPAKKVGYAVVVGDEATMGVVPHAFLAPGEGVRLVIDLADDAAIAVAYCFDLDSRYIYGSAATGETGRWPARSRGLRRRPVDLTPAKILQRFYADAPDPRQLKKSGSSLIRDQT